MKDRHGNEACCQLAVESNYLKHNANCRVFDTERNACLVKMRERAQRKGRRE